jgi:hypothetical protein
MELTRDIACFRSLTWRCDLPPGSDCEVLTQRLSRAGYKPAPSLPGSIVLRSAVGHEIVLVPRTLRAGIRVHYMTEEAARRFAAERIFVTLVKGVLGRAPGGGPGDQ